jgi:hypothetical protein
MRAVSSLMWWLSWAVLGAFVSLLVSTLSVGTKDAAANHLGNGRVESGLWGYGAAQRCHYWYSYAAPRHPCWHPSSIGTAIDYNTGAGTTAGKEAVLYTTGARQHFQIRHVTYCHGAEARIYDRFAGNESFYRGQVRYLHVHPHAWNHLRISDGIGPAIGLVHNGPEVFSCRWEGAHLHQDANTATGTPFWTNWFGNHPFAHPHTICWVSPCP